MYVVKVGHSGDMEVNIARQFDGYLTKRMHGELHEGSS